MGSICYFLFALLITVNTQTPNIIFILMDDQDLLLNSPDYMDNLQSLIVDEGMYIQNGYVSTPVCCPSRTATITGRYFHNIGAPNGSCMNIDAIGNVFSNTTIFQTLYQSGLYNTGVFGKLTNDDETYFCKQNRNVTEAGMSRVYSMCQQNNFYCVNYRDKYKNGTDNLIILNNSLPSTYQSYQIGNKSLEWIENMILNNQSYFGWIGFHCPHVPYTVPPWVQSILTNGWISKLKVPRSASYNYQVMEQQPYLEVQPALLNYTQNWLDYIYQVRIASQLQVDIYIKELIEMLTKYNQLNNTYIIYTSDHGYHLGQYRLPCEKQQIFETDIH
eukprot:216727_1